MPRPVGTIGETKLKILAIIYHNKKQGTHSYGYNVWTLMKQKFYLYMEEGNLRNVYHHLKELNSLGLIKREAYQQVRGSPMRQPYSLTEKGMHLIQRFERFLDVLQTPR